MAKYTITTDDVMRLAADACAVLVCVTRDETYLGSWRTRISGQSARVIDRETNITQSQCRRIAAELLAARLEEATRSGLLADIFEEATNSAGPDGVLPRLEIPGLESTTYQDIIFYADNHASRGLGSIPDFEPEKVIRTFDT